MGRASPTYVQLTRSVLRIVGMGWNDRVRGAGRLAVVERVGGAVHVPPAGVTPLPAQDGRVGAAVDGAAARDPRCERVRVGPRRDVPAAPAPRWRPGGGRRRRTGSGSEEVPESMPARCLHLYNVARPSDLRCCPASSKFEGRASAGLARAAATPVDDRVPRGVPFAALVDGRLPEALEGEPAVARAARRDAALSESHFHS